VQDPWRLLGWACSMRCALDQDVAVEDAYQFAGRTVGTSRSDFRDDLLRGSELHSERTTDIFPEASRAPHRVGTNRFSSSVQLRTTLIRLGASSLLALIIRNRCPSGVTS
jgi:hypothetical protein